MLPPLQAESNQKQPTTSHNAEKDVHQQRRAANSRLNDEYSDDENGAGHDFSYLKQIVQVSVDMWRFKVFRITIDATLQLHRQITARPQSRYLSARSKVLKITIIQSEPDQQVDTITMSRSDTLIHSIHCHRQDYRIRRKFTQLRHHHRREDI